MTPSFLPAVGGAEIVVHNLASALAALEHNVTVATPGYSRSLKGHVPYSLRPVLPGALTLLSRAPLIGTAYFLLELMRLNRGHYDVINLHFALPFGPVLARFRSLCAAPVLITFHGNDIQTEPSIHYGLRLNPAHDRKVRQSIHGADGLIAISGSVRRIIQDIHPGARIFDVPNGVDLGRFRRAQRGRFRSRNRIPSDAPLILAVGRYHPKKGFEHLVHAVSQVVRAFPDACCAIVGRGTRRLGQLVETLHLQSHVLLIDQMEAALSEGVIPTLPPDELVDAYADSDIFVSASIVESFGLSLLEAMAAGVPTIGTDAPGNRDLISNGSNGILCRPQDPAALSASILALLRDRRLRARISQNALKTATAHDWPQIATQYVESYTEVLRTASR